VALTAASLHDSQVAIPLMKMTSERVDYLYDLMDAAYDARPRYRQLINYLRSPEPKVGRSSRPSPAI